MSQHHESDWIITADNVVIWMPREVAGACIDEATRLFPVETGGTFMGWWTNAGTAVITAMIGPGPRATHGRHHFQPDQEWQLEQIAQHYEKSGRRETYLGDWHSHPNRLRNTLSRVDRRVLQQIINTPSARCSTPLMAVLWGRSNDWQVSMWNAKIDQRRILWDRLVLKEATLRLF